MKKKCNYLLSASLITGKLPFLSAAHQSKCNLIGFDTTKSLEIKPGAAGLLCEETEGEILRVLLTARVCKKNMINEYTKKTQRKI